MRRLLFLLLLSSQAWGYLAPSCRNPHRFGLGPEVYFAERRKEGGSEQHGLLYGFRMTYDRVRPWGLYWGIDGHYAHGRLKGHSGRGASLNSNFEVGEVEARFGYAMDFKCRLRPWILPFMGVGYITHVNRFLPPVMLPVRFNISYEYIATGLALGIWLAPQWDVQLVLKAGFPFNMRCKVTNDPSFNDLKQLIDEEVQYWVDLPITYHRCFNGHPVAISLVPFFRYRRFGGREGFPFDFIDTRFQFYGARLLFELRL
jgi:hypothetical protein